MKSKNMKLWVLMLALVLSLSMMTACGGDDEKKPDDEEKAPAEEVEEEEPEEEEEEVDTGYGKTTADATGVVDFDTLKTGFAWLHNATGAEGGYERPTYEEVRDQMGGVDAMKDHESSWKKDYHVYLWQTEGKADFLLLTFKVNEDGSETWNSSSWSDSISDE